MRKENHPLYDNQEFSGDLNEHSGGIFCLQWRISKKEFYIIKNARIKKREPNCNTLINNTYDAWLSQIYAICLDNSIVS